MSEARFLGWTGPDLDIQGPSSTWVDTALFPSWLGRSAYLNLAAKYRTAGFWLCQARRVDYERRKREGAIGGKAPEVRQCIVGDYEQVWVDGKFIAEAKFR